MNEATTTHGDLLSASLRVPEHVVHRGFVAETVVLNLHTGRYHGLNPMGGEMLDAVDRSPSVRAAAEVIVERYEQDRGTVEADLVAFCNDLLARGLLEVVDGPG